MLKSIRVHFIPFFRSFYSHLFCSRPLLIERILIPCDALRMLAMQIARNGNAIFWFRPISNCVCVWMGLSSLASIPITVAVIDAYHSFRARIAQHKIFIELCNANMLSLQMHSIVFCFLFVSCLFDLFEFKLIDRDNKCLKLHAKIV